jgi:hypothetical protein
MKTRLFIIIGLLLFTVPVISQVELKPIDSNRIQEFRKSPKRETFSALGDSAVKNEKAAKRIGLEWIARHGLLAEEALSVVGLHKASRRNGGYKANGNWIWELRLTEFGTMLSGVILIDAKSGKVFAAIPTETKS